MCHFESNWNSDEADFKQEIKVRLAEMIQDGLVEVNEENIIVSEAGRPFVRNVCMAFDLRMLRNKPSTQLFSMTV